MRLEREVGTLNRDVVAIKEKWKIALNIDSKKMAIEKLISMKKFRDTEDIGRKIEEATRAEILEIEKEELLKREYHNDNRDELEELSIKRVSRPASPKPLPASKEPQSEKPTNLTVSWLKERMRRG
jgi:DNA repair exonuclease SbcCD nuclease subunit